MSEMCRDEKMKGSYYFAGLIGRGYIIVVENIQRKEPMHETYMKFLIFKTCNIRTECIFRTACKQTEFQMSVIENFNMIIEYIVDGSNSCQVEDHKS